MLLGFRQRLCDKWFSDSLVVLLDSAIQWGITIYFAPTTYFNPVTWLTKNISVTKECFTMHVYVSWKHNSKRLRKVIKKFYETLSHTFQNTLLARTELSSFTRFKYWFLNATLCSNLNWELKQYRTEFARETMCSLLQISGKEWQKKELIQGIFAMCKSALKLNEIWK